MIHVLFALPCNRRGAAAQLARLSLSARNKGQSDTSEEQESVGRNSTNLPT